MFVLFTLLKLTLDECKTLTKILTRNPSQQFPQTSAHFMHNKVRDKKTGKKQPCNDPGKSIVHTSSLPAFESGSEENRSMSGLLETPT